MRKLHKPKARIKEVIHKYDLPHNLHTEELISIVWSFRNTKDKCHYSTEQLADLCYIGYKSVERTIKILKEKGIINVKKQYNSSNILSPTKKLSDMMSEPTGHRVHLYPSKEGKIEKQEVIRFLESNHSLNEAYKSQQKTFGKETAYQNILKIFNNQKQKQ